MSSYNEKFFLAHKLRYEVWQVKFAEYLQSKYNFSSVFDFGCGIGSYLLGFYQSGVTDVGGLDISLDQSQGYIDDKVKKFIFQYDATVPLDMKRKYDCVMSTEAAEHIRPEGTDVFLDNITRHIDRYLIFTAAVPGQKGTGHINMHPPDFWIKEIEQRGYTFLQQDQEEVRRKLMRIQRRTPFLRNLMIYRKML